MPNINRIRVNNVKYNFGTQCYDDFTMKMYGRNTLYDLANGGGKSVLMLLLMQNLIPNCTLDEKQPIEKLFRTGSKNTTIHSLVEWRLDEVEGGYRYMTTGFCARKARDNEDGDSQIKESAAIEYFNYCILYNEYNQNDIINLSLSDKEERITYLGLKNYLKALAHKDYSLEVMVFERKGEYQRYISRYGLYESQWEIIRGINETEGHVRTYFENNYKTTRKVVEDLLIEEIIEKAYYVKTEKDKGEEDIAKTLVDIKDKLVELSKKKNDIQNYDRQIELINVLIARVTSFLSLYEDKEKVSNILGNVYVTSKAYVEDNEKQLSLLQQKKEDKEKETEVAKKRIDTLKIIKDNYKLDGYKEDIDKLQSVLANNKSEMEELERQLQYKESVNDYIAYLEDKKQVEENEAIIKATRDMDGNGSDEMVFYAAAKKLINDRNSKEYKLQLEKAKVTLETVKKELEISKSLQTKTKVALEVYRGKKENTEEEIGKLRESIKTQNGDTNILLFKDVDAIIGEHNKTIDSCKKDIGELEADISKGWEESTSIDYEITSIKEKLDKVKTDILDNQDRLEVYRNNYDKINHMLKLYDVSDIYKLLPVINEKYVNYVIELHKKEKELEALHKRLKEINDNQLVSVTKGVKAVKEYIETRHGIYIMLGADYISALDNAAKIEILEKYPLLPYGIITEDYAALMEDRNLPNIDTGDIPVPIYDRQAIDNPLGEKSGKGHVIYVAKDGEYFTREDVLASKKKEYEAKLQDISDVISRLKEVGDTYNEDIAYVTKLTDKDFVNAEERETSLKGMESNLNTQLEKLQGRSISLNGKLSEDKVKLSAKKEELNSLISKSGMLEHMAVLSRQLDEENVKLKSYEEEIERLGELEIKTDNEVSHLTFTHMDILNEVKGIEEKLSLMEKDWETYYQEYYVSVEPPAEYKNMPESKIDAQYKALYGVVKNSTVVLEDKRKLIDTLKVSMNRSLKAILKRGIMIEDLKEQATTTGLYAVEEEVLSEFSREIAALSTKEAQLNNEYHNLNRIFDKLSGSIENSVKILEEKYGTMERIDISLEEAKAALEKGDNVLKTIMSEYKELEAEYGRCVKENAMMIDLYKDVKRIVDTTGITLDNAQMVYGDKEELRNQYEDSILVYDKSVKALEKARTELLNYKTKTADTLNQMQVYELARVIANDVIVPDNYSDAQKLLNDLNDITAFVVLEKQRVEKGIEDMEYIKSSFEKQCIERCSDVKTELDKLPKLSHIILDGEAIQMVGLTIPYIKEEFYEQKMSEYIDDVVVKADKYETSEDKMKYIRQRLALKKLFSVIVTDMNNIKLSLYKRERIKEQSRYLKYEEAVGSTGQSQGIYIQFLVSIINYVSGIYATGEETGGLKKTIFIDNPFGAAKDVYIWEPIFELLKVNNVQLIVPARGATPAITGRFDVNYILGQQLVGDKQQTVVIDYRSQVDQEEIEYRPLGYDQVSFDFI